MNSKLTDHLVAVYMTPDRILEAIAALETNGFPKNTLSLVGRNFQIENRPVGFLNYFHREKIWGDIGHCWKTVWEALPDSELVFVPKLGEITFSGLVARNLGESFTIGEETALERTFLNLGGSALCIVEYEWYLQSSRFLLCVHGGSMEIREAKKLLNNTPVARLDWLQINQN